MKPKIKLCRVDNRLLHATVALNWNHFVNANFVAVVDPSHVNDPFLEKVMQLCFPKTMKVKLFSYEALVAFLQEDTASKYNVILLFKDLKCLREAVDCGFHYPEIQMPSPASRILINNLSDYFSQEEIDDIRYIQDAGIKFYFQTAPMDAKDYSSFKNK